MVGFLRSAFALAHVAVAGAIFEDQAGAFDWHQEHIGEAAIVKYEGARAYVGTSGGVVAALNVRTGATAWRYVLPDGELVDQLVLLPKLRGLLLLSGGGKHWQVLGAKSGQLVCEGMTYYGKAGSQTDAVALGEGGGSGKVALLGGNRVFLIDTAKCAQVWSFAPPKLGQGQGGAAAVRLEALSAAAGGEGSVQALGRTAAAAVVTELDAGKGSVLATKTHKMDGGGAEAEGVWIVRPGSAGKALTLITLDGDSLVATDAVGGETVRTPLAKLGLSGGDAAAGAVRLEAVATGLDASASGLVALRSAAAVAVAAVEPSLAAKEFKSYASGGSGGAGGRRLFALAAPSPSFPEEHRGGAVLLTVAAGEAGAEVEAFAAADGASLAKQAWPIAGPLSAGARGGAAALFPALYIVRRDGSLGVRALLRTADHGLTMLQPKRAAAAAASNDARAGGGGTWSREEALASAVQVLFTDARHGQASTGGGPPGSSAAAAAAAVAAQLPGFAGRLALQLKLAAGVPGTLAAAVGAAAKALSSMGGGAGAKGDSSALEFGKTILIMTKPGKLFALRGATGEVLWSRLFSASASGAPQLFEAGASEVLVADVGAATALWLDASSGKTLRRAPFPAGATQMMLLPAAADAAVGALLMLDSGASTAHLVPDTAASRAALAVVAERFTFHATATAPDGRTVLSGYRVLKASGGKGGGGGGGFKTARLWNMVLPAQERIVSSAGSPPREVVSSPVHIRGDDSLLLKYLNPHTVALMTVREDVAAAGGKQQQQQQQQQQPALSSSHAVLYVIDTVSGRTLHRVVHEHAAAPVHIVQTENWVVYTFWNAKAKRTELGSMVLYEGFIDKYGLSPWAARPEVSNEFSSHGAAAPIVLHKTFVFPTGVKAMATTATLHGITSKHLLVGLASDQLYSLDRRFVDPRRPAKTPKPEEQQEGLMQFDPNLPLIPSSIVSYNKTVARIGLIAASPAKFESTSLVLAAGLDLFFVRTTPSQSFDQLASDYNHPLLILLMVALVSATFATWQLSSAQTLKANWK